MHNKLRKVIEDSLKHMAWVCTPGRVFLMSQTLSVWTVRVFKFTRIVRVLFCAQGLRIQTKHVRITNTEKLYLNKV